MYSILHYRIPFSETDAMGIVHHSNHARYFERGRVEFLRLVDINYVEINKRGMHFPLTDMAVSFKKPLKFDDIIIVETKISRLTKVRLNFSYRILLASDFGKDCLQKEPVAGTTLVTGSTDHCCVNEAGRPLAITADVFDQLNKFFVGESV